MFGEYTLNSGARPVQINVTAEIGVAEWAPGQTMDELLKRADAKLLSQKSNAMSAGGRV